jgi:putative acyl-CoA dehydrogenase
MTISYEEIALALSASLLIRHAPHEIADAFIASRLTGPWSSHFGTLPRGVNARSPSHREKRRRILLLAPRNDSQ